MTDYQAIYTGDGAGTKTRLTFPSKGGQKATLDSLPDYAPPEAATAPAAKLDALPDFQPAEAAPDAADQAPAPDVGTGEAALSGVRSGLTFGAAPALAGVTEAAKAPGGGTIEDVAGGAGKLLDLANPLSMISEKLGLPNNHDLVRGAARLIHHYGSGEADQSAVEAYNRGREAALKDQGLAKEQHPHAYLAGLLGGSLLVPVPGGAGGSLAANAARTAGTGAVMGAAQGVGEGISEGQTAGEIAARGARGGVIGGGVGGAVGAVLPRVIGALTPGSRAAQTAAGLGAPLPRGLASDRPAINAATASARSVPIIGSRISTAVNRTQHAAGERVGDIATGMTGGPLDRAASNAIVRPGIEAAIANNRRVIDHLYGDVRSRIDQRARFTMPRTDQVLNEVMRARAEAGHVNPAEGLEQFRNVAGGATFNGAHRARVDAREAGNGAVPHPGYNAADYNRITRAMTADLRAMVNSAAHGGAQQKAAAVAAFDQAERSFGPIAELNARLSKIGNSQGEGAIATLLGAAREKGGDVRLLAQLRATMPAAEFQQIGGLLLHELGNNPTTGEFSLAKFVTGFEKLSPRARGVLFSPQHLRDIEDIVQMGQHIKGAIRESNTSHTSNALILFDLARDAVMVGAGVAMGVVSGGGVAAGAAGAAPAILFAHWLASPAQAAAMGAWSRAYRAATLGAPTPARVAALKIASRNLANNLGLPVDKVMQTIQGRLTSRADESGEEQGPK